jgi:hypothetical protein
VRAPGVLALCALLATSAGCGGGRARPPTATERAVRQAEHTHEYPSPPSPSERAKAGAPSPVAAIRAFVTVYINWSFQTVAVQLRALAEQSVGQARAATALAAAQTANDYELTRGGVSNQGKVEAIAPLAEHPNQYVVVTRELTTATDTTVYQGLRPAWHLALATVSRLGDGRWVLSGWQPET